MTTIAGLRDSPHAVAVVVGAACASAILGAAAALAGPFLLVALAGLLLVAVVAARPPLAAYLLVGLTPLIVGIDRGAIVPILRPNEVLIVALAGGLSVRAISDHLTGRRPLRLPFGRLGVAILVMAVASSVLPLLWLVARGLPITEDDLLHALMLWKYVGVFLIVRMSLSSAREVRTCLWVAMGAGAVVALIGVAQVLNLFGIQGFVTTHFVEEGFQDTTDHARASATLGSSLAMADVMTLNLLIAAGWLFRGGRPQRALLIAAGVFLAGTLAAGQFTGVIGLGVAALVLGIMTGRLRQIVAAGLVGGLVAGLSLRSVIQARLSGFDSIYGLPQSWVGRWQNLRTYFWPELRDPWNAALGVRPSARLPAVETWRDFIWIESGYTWLLWAGGLPLLAAFFAFLYIALRDTGLTSFERDDEIGVAALAAFVGVSMLSVLMVLDPHLTLRGAGDLLFALLAMAALRPPEGSRPPASAAEASALAPSPGAPPIPRHEERP